MTRFHPIDILTLAELHNRDPEAALRIASESAREALAALHALPQSRDELRARTVDRDPKSNEVGE